MTHLEQALRREASMATEEPPPVPADWVPVLSSHHAEGADGRPAHVRRVYFDRTRGVFVATAQMGPVALEVESEHYFEARMRLSRAILEAMRVLPVRSTPASGDAG